MKSTIFCVRFLLFFLFCSSCIIDSSSSNSMYLSSKDSCGFSVSPLSGRGVRWNPSQFPVSFYIHESVPYTAKQNFLSSIDHWNMVWKAYLENEGFETFSLFKVESENMVYKGKPRNDGYNMLFFVKKDFSIYAKPEVQAITAISSNREGDIRDTDIIVNSESFNYFYDPEYNEEVSIAQNQLETQRHLASLRSKSLWFDFKEILLNWFEFFLKPFKKPFVFRGIAKTSKKIPRHQVDFPSLIIHELGHVPGLGHFDFSDHMKLKFNKNSSHMASKAESHRFNKSVNSVMEPFLAHGKFRREIEEYDLNNLLCGYLK